MKSCKAAANLQALAEEDDQPGLRLGHQLVLVHFEHLPLDGGDELGLGLWVQVVCHPGLETHKTKGAVLAAKAVGTHKVREVSGPRWQWRHTATAVS